MKKALVILLFALVSIVLLLSWFGRGSADSEPKTPIDEEVFVA